MYVHQRESVSDWGSWCSWTGVASCHRATAFCRAAYALRGPAFHPRIERTKQAFHIAGTNGVYHSVSDGDP